MQLEARNVGYAYTPNVPVLRDISFKLEPGKILYVLGRNGSGKTTLLSCLAGILKPARGQVLLGGVDIHKYSPGERARRVGLIPQMHVPAFAYTVREMVLMGRAPHLGLFGSPSRADYQVAEQALDSVGLTPLRDRPYTELSGGERQLVMIARGLAQRCQILLMDEPDAHLDPNNQHRVMEIVAQLAGQGLSFVVSSHAPNNALIYADRVLLLKEGRTTALGTAEETLTEPLLSTTYGMGTEVIYGSEDGSHIPRAILPRRPMFLDPASLDSPDSPLAHIFAESEHTPQLILVTGFSGSGKSTWCAELDGQARQQGLTVRGLLSPAVFVDGRKVGIDMVDLSSGERRRLANLRGEASTGLITTQWKFDPEVVEWGNHILGDLPPSDLLVIDELGPLEFIRDEGLLEGLRLIDDRKFKVACVVVRPSLLADAQQRWPFARVVSVAGSKSDSAQTPGEGHSGSRHPARSPQPTR